MRLKHKLALLMVLAAAAPILLLGWAALQIAERSAIAAAEESERHDAYTTGARIAAEVQRARLLLRLFARRSFDFVALTPDDVLAAERLISGLDQRITATSIVRSDGSASGPSYYRSDPPAGSKRSAIGREPANPAAHVPLAEALANDEAISPIYRNASGEVRIAIAAASDPAELASARVVVVAEIALDELVAAVAPGTLLFDADGRLAIGPEGASRPIAAQPARWGPGVTMRAGAMLRSFAAVPGLGWGVGAQRPLREILAPSRHLRVRIAEWAIACAIAALVAGLLFARSITRPLEALAAAATDLGAGNFDRRVSRGSYEEVALVARAFNRMAEDLQSSHAQLRHWNSELEEMVKSRTAELREAIEQLLLAHRLSAIGQLGAGVAHEINNPLTYLTGALQVLGVAHADKRDQMIGKCLQSARRIQEVVAGLLQVSQPHGDGERVAADVNSLLENALRLVEGQLAERSITVRRDFAASLPRVYADPSLLIQALVQILSNARDAMPNGGEIVIETRGAIGDKLVMLRIADTGCGIRREDLDRIFDPFFTTQAHAGHRGLGLSVAYRIVKDHGGSIVPESQVGVGTRIALRLPALPRTMSLA